jgi:hypothetical protein
MITIALTMFLSTYLLFIQLIQVYAYVPMILYECFYISKSKKINANLNYHFKT